MEICGPTNNNKKKDFNSPNLEKNIENKPTLKRKKNYAIISVVYNNNEELELYLDKNKKLSDLINEMNLDLEYDYDFYDSNRILINDKINKEIEKIFDIKNPISIIIKQYSLKISRNIREYFSNKIHLIGTLLFNSPFLLGIFIYNKNSKQIFSFEYPFQNYSQLNFINHFTAFCNSNNSLYISGGGNENEGKNDFIKINLEEIKENELIYTNLISLKYKRYWHSMIFIPEKYIFIIGGNKVKEVEMYDIVEDEITIEGKLNYERCEPSLILVNNKYLYCICGFQLNNNFVDTIEKCNLCKRQRKWEIVNYQIQLEEESATVRSLIVSFFGVSYINDNIVLIGDKEYNKIINPNYLLKPNDKDIDIIEEYGFIEANNIRLFSEKFFIPININESISLPFKKGKPTILILNNNDGNIKEISLKEYDEENEI